MSQQSEEAEAVPNVPTMEQMAQMVQMLAAREVIRLRASDRARTRSPDPEPQIDVEVALLNKGAKAVSARPSWAEMRRAVMQAFGLKEREEARLRYSYASTLTGNPLLVENEADWTKALDNTRRANKNLIELQARHRHFTLDPRGIKQEVVDLTYEEYSWKGPLPVSQPGGRLSGSHRVRPNRTIPQRLRERDTSELSTEDDGDTNSFAGSTKTRYSSGYDTNHPEEIMSDAPDETETKLPGPKMRDLTETAPDREIAPEAEDEPSPNDYNEIERNGDGLDKGRPTLEDPREDVTKSSPSSTTGEVESAEDSDKSDESGEGEPEGGDGESNNPTENVGEKTPKEPSERDAAPTVSRSGSKDKGVGPPAELGDHPDRRVKTPRHKYTCVAEGCQSKDNQIKGHRVPRNEARRKVWMQAINSPNTGVHRQWICRNHFDEEDYITSINGVKTLDRRAVPHPTNRNSVTTQEADRDKEKPNVDRKMRARGPEAGGTTEQENTEIERDQTLGEGGQIECPECGDPAEEQQLQEHLIKAHKYNQRCCPKEGCDFKFEEGKPANNIHHYMKHWRGYYPCKYCKAPYATEHALDNHQKAAHAVKTTATITCGLRGCDERKIVGPINPLLRHVKSYHASLCYVCHQRVKGTSRLTEHLRKRHGEDPPLYHCRYCAKTTATKACMVDHLGEAHRIRYECKTCDVQFLWARGLRRHQKRLHHSEEPEAESQAEDSTGEQEAESQTEDSTVDPEAESQGETEEPTADDESMAEEETENPGKEHQQNDELDADMEVSEVENQPAQLNPRNKVCGCIPGGEKAAPGLAIQKGTNIEELSEYLIQRRHKAIELLRDRPITDEEKREHVQIIRLEPIAGYKPSKWSPDTDNQSDRPCIERQENGQPTVRVPEGEAATIYVIPCERCAEGVWIGALAVHSVLEKAAANEFTAQIESILPMLVKRLPNRISGNNRTRGTERCCNKKTAAFLFNRLLNFGCVVERRHHRCAKSQAVPPYPELPGVKLTSGRTPDSQMENKNVQELARKGRELAYEVGLTLKIVIPEVYELHTTPTESSCRIDPEDRRENNQTGENVGKCFSGGSLLADVSTHPHRDRGNRPGTASAMAILRSDSSAGAQQHFIQGYKITGGKAGPKSEVVMELAAGDIYFEDSHQIFHGSTPAADRKTITRLGVAYFMSDQLEEKNHSADTVQKTTNKRGRNNPQQNGSQGKNKKNSKAKKPRK